MLKINRKSLIKYSLSTLTVAVLAIAGFFIWQTKETKAGWWNDAWSYRQAIEVSTTAAAEQTNVYITLTLNTDTASTSMQDDCGDFRFTKENGEVLPYYIVSGCRTTNNVIHVNFAVFPPYQQTLYFYYGNPSAENGFSATDFSAEAANYTVGAVGSVETGPGPVGYWRFDEGFGATAQDSTANNNDGTITGATWQDESQCVVGKCLFFDGSDDYVDIGAVPALYSSTFSASAWYKPTNMDTQWSRIMQIGLNDGGWGIESDSGEIDNMPYGVIWQGGAYTRIGPEISRPVNIDTWHHIELVYDSSIEIGYFYLDGFIIAEVSGLISTPTDFTFNIARLADNSRYFQGFIDEVKIYPYARSADEIKEDYAAGLAGISTAHGVSAAFGSGSDRWMSDGLVGYWKMDESTTTSGAIDSSGNENTGAYYGHASTTGGKFGNGGIFDGVDDYAEIAGSFPIGNSQRTISFWFKAEAFEGNAMVGYEYDGNNGNDFMINAEESNAVSVGFYGHSIITPIGELNTKTWYFATVVVPSGATLTSDVLVYINGSVQSLTETES